MRKFAYNGAQALAVITEDSWSYSDESLLQHFYMSVFRAIENRRDLVHNGNSGVTGHISSTGKIISTLPFWRPDYLIANVALNDKITIYTRFGEWLIYLCVIAIMIFLLSATTKTLYELKEIIKERLFSNKLEPIEETAVPSAKKVDEYINNDNNHDLPSLDDLDDIVNKKDINTNKEDTQNKTSIAEEKQYPDKKTYKNDIIENVHSKEENKKLDSNKKIDLFPDNNANYSKEMSEIINNSKSYSIFEKDKYTSEISSSLSKIIEENEESLNNRDIKKNNNLIKED